MSKRKWKALVRLPNGFTEWREVEADSPQNAKVIIENMTGGVVLGGVAQVYEPAELTLPSGSSEKIPSSRPARHAYADTMPSAPMSDEAIEFWWNLAVAVCIGVFLSNFPIWKGFLASFFALTSALFHLATGTVSRYLLLGPLHKIGIDAFIPQVVGDYAIIGVIYWLSRELSPQSEYRMQTSENSIGWGARMFRSVILWPIDIVILKPFGAGRTWRKIAGHVILESSLTIVLVLLLVNSFLDGDAPRQSTMSARPAVTSGPAVPSANEVTQPAAETRQTMAQLRVTPEMEPALRNAISGALTAGHTVDWKSGTSELSGTVLVGEPQAYANGRVCRSYGYTVFNGQNSWKAPLHYACQDASGAWSLDVRF